MTITRNTRPHLADYCYEARVLTCDLHPLPTSLLNEKNIFSILPFINYSLPFGHVSEEFKVAHITPLLKNTLWVKRF